MRWLARLYNLRFLCQSLPAPLLLYLQASCGRLSLLYLFLLLRLLSLLLRLLPLLSLLSLLRLLPLPLLALTEFIISP